MIIDLTGDDLQQIQDWYDAAAGEWATCAGTPEGNQRLKSLLEKLNLRVHVVHELENGKPTRWTL